MSKAKRRVVGAGLPRTGTSSLAFALEILGYDRVLHSHCGNALSDLVCPDADALELQKQSGVSLEELTSSWDATLDSPTADFYAEMSELFPGSAVILTVRDSDQQWWASWYRTLGVFFGSDWRGRLLRLFLWMDWGSHERNDMISHFTHLWRSKYGSYGPDIHTHHNLEVQRRISPERLLVFNVKQGWEPLCRFLGEDVPLRPFPRM
ncbi:hypothetical protein DM02DRAFT_599638 [Periconia macrospinosa]|uniref:P-loop containing nucleoside triphosphate hydrolase protein n=1 Tax=Periconia macrospinosa TaxID=97972 RepID=A0A2V1DDV1_9PLEO|nr:hypothetical protein DM02DRAFT_599638 [Periconia macrospinosa]